MLRSVDIERMDIEDYMEKYGEKYNEGELFDYPIEELNYILEETEIEQLAIIDNRLYELSDSDESDNYITVSIIKDEDFLNIYWGMRYKNDLSDFKLDEISYILSNGNIDELFLYNNKLYELF